LPEALQQKDRKAVPVFNLNDYSTSENIIIQTTKLLLGLHPPQMLPHFRWYSE